MTEIIIDNLKFYLSCIEDNDVIIKVYDNEEDCGQGLFSIQHFDFNEDYYLYKWFDENYGNDNNRHFPSCIESKNDDENNDDGEYYRIKITGVDEI